MSLIVTWVVALLSLMLSLVLVSTWRVWRFCLFDCFVLFVLIVWLSLLGVFVDLFCSMQCLLVIFVFDVAFVFTCVL